MAGPLRKLRLLATTVQIAGVGVSVGGFSRVSPVVCSVIGVGVGSGVAVARRFFDLAVADTVDALLLLHGDAGKIGDVLARPGQEIEDGGFPAVGLAGEGHDVSGHPF